MNPTFNSEGDFILPSRLRAVFLERKEEEPTFKTPEEEDLYYDQWDDDLVLDVREPDVAQIAERAEQADDTEDPLAHLFPPIAPRKPQREVDIEALFDEEPESFDAKIARILKADQQARRIRHARADTDPYHTNKLHRSIKRLGQSAMKLIKKAPALLPKPEHIRPPMSRRVKALLGGAALCLVASVGVAGSNIDQPTSAHSPSTTTFVEYESTTSSTPTTITTTTTISPEIQTALGSPEFAAIVERPQDFANMVQWTEQNPGQDFQTAIERWMNASSQNTGSSSLPHTS